MKINDLFIKSNLRENYIQLTDLTESTFYNLLARAIKSFQLWVLTRSLAYFLCSRTDSRNGEAASGHD